MAVAGSLLIDTLAAIALQPRGVSLLSLQSDLLGVPADQRSYWVKGSKPGELLRRVAAVPEREPGELP
jgi:hypothetical protein